MTYYYRRVGGSHGGTKSAPTRKYIVVLDANGRRVDSFLNIHNARRLYSPLKRWENETRVRT